MAKDAPKTEPTPAPEAFNHPGKRVFLLLPADQKEREICLKHLEDSVFPTLEKLPVVTADLDLNRFRGDEVVYFSHPIDERVKGADGRYSQGTVVHVSEGMSTDKFLTADADGFTTVDVRALKGALSRLAKPSRAGRCYYTRETEDNHVKIVNY